VTGSFIAKRIILIILQKTNSKLKIANWYMGLSDLDNLKRILQLNERG